MLLRDVQSELELPRSCHRCSAEKRALQQVLLVEDVVDVKLGTNQCATETKAESGAAVQNEAGFHLNTLVEIEQTGAVGTTTTSWIHTVGQPRAIDPRKAGIGVT